MSARSPYTIIKVWRRVYEVRTITEEGAFAVGEVPSDYGGSRMDIKVSQRLIFASDTGVITELRMDDTDDVKDSSRNAGMGVEADFGNGYILTIPPTGPSVKYVTWSYEDSKQMDADDSAQALAMYKHYISEEDLV